MKKLLRKIRICWNILTGKYEHWVLLNQSSNDHYKMYQDMETRYFVSGENVDEYMFHLWVRRICSLKSDVDMMEMKAKCQAEVYQISMEREGISEETSSERIPK